MTNLIQMQAQTMSSKEHKNVKRDIEVMAEQLELDVSKFGRIYLNSKITRTRNGGMLWAIQITKW